VSSFEERAARRRREWQGGVAKDFAAMDAEDLAFWLRASPAERIRAVQLLNLELAELRGSHESPARLQRSLGGVRQRGR
jgi:hypothetical protein